MPFVGLKLPEELLIHLASFLREGINSSSKLQELFPNVSFHLRREAYLGDYHLEGHLAELGFFPIASFGMLPLPGCRAVCVFYHAEVQPIFRAVGVGRELLRIRTVAAKQVGFTIALATVKANNSVEEHLLGSEGWKPAFGFINKTTAHDVRAWIRML